MGELVQLGLGGGALGILFLLGRKLLEAHLVTMTRVVETMDSITRTQAEITQAFHRQEANSEQRHREIIQRLDKLAS